MPFRTSYGGSRSAAVPDADALEGLRAGAASAAAQPAPAAERYFVVAELRRRTPRFAELALDGRIVARLMGDSLSLYEAIDAALGQQDIVVTADESVEITGDLAYLSRDHQDIDGRLVVRRPGDAAPVSTVRFGGAAGQARPAFYRPSPSGSEDATRAVRAFA